MGPSRAFALLHFFTLLGFILIPCLAVRRNLASQASGTEAVSSLTLQSQRLFRGEKPVCNVTAFGATAGGLILDTEAIQKAIDACASAGGGTVFFPPGLYLTGTVFLKSNTILHIAEGATVLGSPNQKDYPVERSQWYVILAENATSVGITGGGTVDGQALKFVEKFDKRKYVMVSWNETGACMGDECRPRLIGFLGCKHIRVWNIHLEEPAYWCLHVVRSDDILIHDISIHGDFNIPNNDGIDIEDSNNTFITHCHIDTGDDAICPKTTNGPLHNLTVANCWIRTKSCGVKFGSASNFDFKRLLFYNIRIVDSHRGLGMQLRDPGNISDVTFLNISISTRYYDPSWWGRAEPIYVTACPRDSSTHVGSISNVSFLNITANSENGIILSGSGGGFLHNIRFENVQVKLKRWTRDKGGLLDYRPGCQGLVHHQNSGVFMENISELSMLNVSLIWNASRQLSILPLDFTPSTIGTIELRNFESALSVK